MVRRDLVRLKLVAYLVSRYIVYNMYNICDTFPLLPLIDSRPLNQAVDSQDGAYFYEPRSSYLILRASTEMRGPVDRLVLTNVDDEWK